LLVTNYKIKNDNEDVLKKADNETIVNSEIKKLSEMIYKREFNLQTIELLDVLVDSLEDHDLILSKKKEEKKYLFSKELSDGVVFEKNIVEKLPDGKKIIVSKINNKIEIKDKEGKKIELKGELSKEIFVDPRDFVIEAYLVEKNDNKIIYATDVFYLNEDLTKISSIERKKYLKTISFSTKFRLNPFIVVPKDNVDKAKNLFSKSINSKGCIIRDYENSNNEIRVIDNGN
jgi:hypothetical protein